MSYPPANRKTVDNISSQLLSVPPFYFKVCSLMEEMLLPLPFSEDTSELNEWVIAYDFVTSRVNSLMRSEALTSSGIEALGELVRYFREKQLKELQSKLMTDSFEAVKPLAQTFFKLIDSEELQAENSRVKRNEFLPRSSPSKGVKCDADASIYDYRVVEERSDYEEDILQEAEIRAQCVSFECNDI